MSIKSFTRATHTFQGLLFLLLFISHLSLKADAQTDSSVSTTFRQVEKSREGAKSPRKETVKVYHPPRNCFLTTDGLNGHCQDKTWGKGEEAPAGCRCAPVMKNKKISGCQCFCDPAKYKICVMKWDRDTTKGKWDASGDRYAYCACKRGFKLASNITELGTCIKNFGVQNVAFKNLLLLGVLIVMYIS